MTWAIAKKPTMDIATTYDPRNPPPKSQLISHVLVAAAKQNGTENEPTLIRLVKAFEKWEAGPLVDKSEVVFMGYELEAAIEAFNQAHPKEG
jgi:hypothetical protein